MTQRIGILTLFKSHNYGTFLQCYSLVKELMRYKDFEVEVIDCATWVAEKMHLLSFKDPYKKLYSMQTFFRFMKLRNILRKRLPLSRKSLLTNDYEKAVDFISSQNYDFIIVGSDEVWKVLPHFKFPNMYWLHERIKARKFSYAASANKTNFALLSDDKKKLMSERLRDFEYLGVRDDTTIQELSKIDGSLNFHKNPDPAFLYEFEGAHDLQNKLMRKYKITFRKPVIALTTRDLRISKAVLDKFGSEYEIVSVFRSNKYVEKYILDLDYFEWARVFSYFSGVVTDLFHGTIFCLKNGTPFVSVDDMDTYLDYPGKIEDLLNGIGLRDNYFNMKNLDFDMDLMLEKLRYNMNTRDQQREIMQNICEYKKKEAQNCIAYIMEKMKTKELSVLRI